MKLISGTLFIGVAAILLLIYEWNFVSHAQVGQAVVIESSGYGFLNLNRTRSGLTIADVLLIVDGQHVPATLRAWYAHLSPGQQVQVLFLPGDPKNVVPDWYLQQHYASTLALVVFAVLATLDVLKFRACRRRQAVAMLRDDYVSPHIPSRRTLTLPIDTSPRLWDHELDG